MLAAPGFLEIQSKPLLHAFLQPIDVFIVTFESRGAEKHGTQRTRIPAGRPTRHNHFFDRLLLQDSVPGATDVKSCQRGTEDTLPVLSGANRKPLNQVVGNNQSVQMEMIEMIEWSQQFLQSLRVIALAL